MSNNKCGDDESLCRIVLVTDNYPWENSWSLNNSGVTIASGPPLGTNYDRGMMYIGSMCLKEGDYVFKMGDISGDGICCEFGQGSVTITCDGEAVVKSDDSNFEEVKYGFRTAPKELSANIFSNPDPTRRPTKRPTNRPTPTPTKRPTKPPVLMFDVSISEFMQAESIPVQTSSNNSPKKCFNTEMYDDIDDDVASIVSQVSSAEERAHTMGGIVRLAAHDVSSFLLLRRMMLYFCCAHKNARHISCTVPVYGLQSKEHLEAVRERRVHRLERRHQRGARYDMVR